MVKVIYTFGGEFEIFPRDIPIFFPLKIIYLILWVLGLVTIKTTATGSYERSTSTIKIYVNQVFASTRAFPFFRDFVRELIDSELHEYLHSLGLDDKQIQRTNLFPKSKWVKTVKFSAVRISVKGD